MVAAVLLSLLVGVSLGVLGGGGSILTVPIFVYALEVDPRVALPSSLVVVGVTSLVALSGHPVRWREGTAFAATSVLTSAMAGHLSRHVPSAWLMVGLASVMIAAAMAMSRPRPEVAGGPPRALAVAAAGGAVGVCTGLAGVGGGFLIVPALTTFGGLGLREAIGTSLLAIAVNCAAALAGHLTHATIDLPLTTLITGCAVVGSLAGVRIAPRLPVPILRRSFAVMLVAVAAFILFREAR